MNGHVPRSGNRGRHAHGWRWLAALAILLSMLTTLPVAAQGDDPVATPIGTEPPMIVEQPTGPTGEETETPDPTSREANPAGDGPVLLESTPGSVTISTRGCVPGTDPAAGYTTLAGACAIPLGGWTITLLDLNGIQSLPTDGAGNAVFSSVVPQADGTILVHESLPAPDVQLSVFCSESGPGGYAPVSSAGGDVTLAPSTTTAFAIECTFFNMTPPATPGDLVIELATCPLGFDLATDLLSDCTTLTDGVTFTLSGSGGTQTGVTGDDGTGRTRFEALDAGTVTITQATPPGTASSFVWGCFVLDGASVVPFEPLSTGNTLTYTMEPGKSYLCEWYNVPSEVRTPENTVVMSKIDCPAGTTPATTIDEMLAACGTTPQTDIGFTLVDASGPRPATTGTEGRILWGNVIPVDGQVQITETIPAGYGDPVVFCSEIEGGTTLPESPVYVPVAATGGAFTLSPTLTAPWTFLCTAFNIPHGDPAGEGGTVRVIKYTCPAGVARSDDDYALSEQCREDVAPVSFEVSDSAGADVPLTLTPGVPQSGDVTDLAFGTVWIAEIVPAGYGEPLVFCSDTPADGAGNYEPVAVSGGNSVSVELRAEAELPLTCLFFNFTDDDSNSGDVTITKYFCAATVDATADWPVLADQCTEPGPSVDITVTSGAYHETVSTSGAPPTAMFADVPYGTVYIEETIPDGYQWPRLFCSDTASDGMGVFDEVIPGAESEAGAFAWEHNPDATAPLRCIVFNFLDDDGSTVTVNKYVCPSWVNPETDVLADACPRGGDGIPFTFVDGNGMHPAAVTGGGITWTDVVIGAEGELQIIETIPAGYGDPLVVCDGLRMASANGFVIPNPGLEDPFHVVCDWYNLALEDSNLAVIKHTCPAGYDPEAPGAAPATDCPTLTDGVDIRIVGASTDMTSTTGDAGTGTVHFGGLDPGDYTITETMPAGTAMAFVSECTGNAVGAVRPWPLATGETLNITVNAGESITCHWYNVPGLEGGALTVIKYHCTGDTYVSEVDCQVYEGGATFDLHGWDGAAWQYLATEATDSHGRIAWTGMAPGRYTLDEHDGAWCHLASDQIEAGGDAFTVSDGAETVVKVYNCGATPGQPGTTPTKYPNTGVPPASGGSGAPVELPMAVVLTGAALTRRRFAAMAALAPAAVLVRRAIAQDGAATDGTAGAALPARSLCLPAPPEGEATACARGPVPATLRIAAIGVDAPVEILETVAGEMQQPTDETHVAWYKETARIGEPGNMLLAGHLNWWGVPEAVFYNLERLAAGDTVTVTASDGAGATFAVQWVRQEPVDQPASAEVLGPTDHAAVTLITCGGDWDRDTARYTHRTVVRARQIDVSA